MKFLSIIQCLSEGEPQLANKWDKDSRINFFFYGIAIFAACLLAALIPIGSYAEKMDSSVRPRIGLVLSGGGARGLAHIGVLQMLDEMRVPVDYIAGTSMGAIVGGLYASGLSPREIAQIVTSLEWNVAFQDTPPLQDLSFRRKEDYADFLSKLELGFKDGRLKLPMGLLQGQNLGLILKALIGPSENIHDFDHFNIPFRAVATNIETGEQEIIGSGELSTAIRASMSIPGIFAPVAREGKLLVDGGISANLPVNVARQMGADILIVVDIGTPLRTKEQLDSAMTITLQLLTILIQRNTQEQLKTLTARDILISPQLGEIGSGDFNRGNEAIPIGRKAAEAVKSQLQCLSITPEQYAAYISRQRRGEVPPAVVDYVRIDNKSRVSDQVIEARLHAKPGDPLDMNMLQKDLTGIYGIDAFDRVDYHLEEKDGKKGLVVEATDKSWRPNYFRFGLNLEDDFKGSSNYNLALSFTRTAVNSLGAEWRSVAQIGATPRVFTEFYQPVDDTLSYFIAPRFEYKEQSYNLYSSTKIAAQYRVMTVEGGLDVGRQFGNWGEWRFGIRRGYGSVNEHIGDPSYSGDHFDTGGLYTQFQYNRLDNFNFPQHGTNAAIAWEVSTRELGDDFNLNVLVGHWLSAFTWGSNTLLTSITVRTTTDDSAPIQNMFPMGGFLNLSGYSKDELSGRYTGLARLIYWRKVAGHGLSALKIPVYVGTSYEAGNAWQKSADIGFDSIISAGSVFIGADTYIGPLYFAYGFAEGGHNALYLYLGRTF